MYTPLPSVLRRRMTDAVLRLPYVLRRRMTHNTSWAPNARAHTEGSSTRLRDTSSDKVADIQSGAPMLLITAPPASKAVQSGRQLNRMLLGIAYGPQKLFLTSKVVPDIKSCASEPAATCRLPGSAPFLPPGWRNDMCVTTHIFTMNFTHDFVLIFLKMI